MSATSEGALRESLDWYRRIAAKSLNPAPKARAEAAITRLTKQLEQVQS